VAPIGTRAQLPRLAIIWVKDAPTGIHGGLRIYMTYEGIAPTDIYKELGEKFINGE